MAAQIKIALIGDIVGAPGRAMFKKHVPIIKKKYNLNAVVVNGENSAHGRGITSSIVQFFLHYGAQVITTGNHIWANKEIYSYLDSSNIVLRPANFPTQCPGRGLTVVECEGFSLGVLNLQGRLFMRELVDCPFRAADTALSYLRSKTSIILVDFHAETTSEKMALGFYLDGRVSAVVGTHTHIQTADQRILPKGTAYVTDLGMAGALNSMIGMQKESVMRNIITQMPQRFVVDIEPPFVLSGVIVTIDKTSGKALAIEQLRIVDSEVVLEFEKGE